MIKYSMLYMQTRVRSFFHKILHDEKGEVNIVATVVLIGIAVILAVIFKDEIAKLLKDLLGQISGSAKDAVTQSPGGATQPSTGP